MFVCVCISADTYYYVCVCACVSVPVALTARIERFGVSQRLKTGVTGADPEGSPGGT